MCTLFYNTDQLSMSSRKTVCNDNEKWRIRSRSAFEDKGDSSSLEAQNVHHQLEELRNKVDTARRYPIKPPLSKFVIWRIVRGRKHWQRLWGFVRPRVKIVSSYGRS